VLCVKCVSTASTAYWWSSNIVPEKSAASIARLELVLYFEVEAVGSS